MSNALPDDDGRVEPPTTKAGVLTLQVLACVVAAIALTAVVTLLAKYLI